MTDPHKCGLLIYHCDEAGRPTAEEGPYPFPDFIDALIGDDPIRYEQEWLVAPDDWPLMDYPHCICGSSVIGDEHLVLQWGNMDNDHRDEDWAEWQIAMHEECIYDLLQEMTDGCLYWDEEDELAERDECNPALCQDVY